MVSLFLLELSRRKKKPWNVLASQEFFGGADEEFTYGDQTRLSYTGQVALLYPSPATPAR
jgi:hypothetical protein